MARPHHDVVNYLSGAHHISHYLCSPPFLFLSVHEAAQLSCSAERGHFHGRILVNGISLQCVFHVLGNAFIVRSSFRTRHSGAAIHDHQRSASSHDKCQILQSPLHKFRYWLVLSTCWDRSTVTKVLPWGVSRRRLINERVTQTRPKGKKRPAPTT